MITHCFRCGHKFSKKVLAEKKKKKGSAVKRALKLRQEAGLAVGRPRVFDYEKIRSFHGKGLSLRVVARHFGCSLGIVQRAVAIKK